MKKLRIILGIASFSLLAIACVHEAQLPVQETEYRLTASIEPSQETRTTMSPITDGVSKAMWSSGDRIGVFVDGTPNLYPYTLVEGEGTANAVFTGYGAGQHYIAVYPYSMVSGLEDGMVMLTLPSEQTYREGSFSDGSYPMVAVSNTTDLPFRNLCSLMRISITGHHHLTSIVFRTNNPQVKVTGPATVSLADPSNPVLTMSEEACDSLVLRTDGVVLQDGMPTDFYLVLPAQTYKGGFSIRIYTTTGYMEKSLESDFTMVRARRHDAATFALKLDAGVDPSAALAGSGSDNDPFLIGSIGDLLAMRDAVNNHDKIGSLSGDRIDAATSSYRLTTDLDLSPLCGEKAGENWVPIGDYGSDYQTTFSGSFDGGGHEISNLYIHAGGLHYRGFFGRLTGGKVRNLTVSGDMFVCGNSGLIAGDIDYASLVEDCVSKGSVRGDSQLGGLVGYCCGTIVSSRNEAEIKGVYGDVGGIAGVIYYIDVHRCVNVGKVSGEHRTGGIVGELKAGKVYDCVNRGEVTGTQWVGGIAAYLSTGGKVLNSFNTGDVTGEEYVGGINGFASSLYTAYEGASAVVNSFNTGTVRMSGGRYGGYLAGFIGLTDEEEPIGDEPASNAWVMNSYWLVGCGEGVASAVGGGPGLAEDNFALTDEQFKGAPYDGALFTTSDGSTFNLLVDALNAGAVKWSKPWKKTELSGWESVPGSYPALSDLPAIMPGSTTQIFEIDGTEFEFNVKSDRFQVSVTSSHAYSVQGLPDWISETSVEPVPNKPHTKIHVFTVQDNDSGKARKVTFAFVNSEGRTLRVKVSQREPYLRISDTEASFFAPGGSKTVVISSSISWTAKVGEHTDWYSVSPDSGYGVGSVTITVKENKGSAARGGYVVIASADGTVEHKVNFVQSGVTGESSEDWKELPFYHQSVIFRFTATWCTWCPYMGAAITRAQELYPGKIQHVALHGSASDLEFSPTVSMMSFYSAGGYPSGVVDGRAVVSNNTDLEAAAANFVRIVKETEDTYDTATGLAIRSSATGQNVSIDLTGYFKKAGNYKVTVLLLEDGIINYQENGGKDYVHNHVARVAATDVFGDSFTVASDLSTKDFHYEVRVPTVCKVENMRVLAYFHRPFGDMPRLQTGNYGDFFFDNCATAPVGEVLKVALVGSSGGGGDSGGQGNEGFTPGGEIK